MTECQFACQNTVWDFELTCGGISNDQKDNEEIEKYERVQQEMNHKKNIKDAEANVKSLELKQSAAKIKTEKTTKDQDAQKTELENAKEQLLDAKIESAIWFIKEGKNTK